MNGYIPPERSLGGLFTELTQETTTLFRQEIQLAKSEMTEKVRKAGAGIVTIAIGAVLALVAFQALVASAICGLALALPWWLSALIVGVVLMLLGAAAAMRGLSALRRERLAPRRTIESLRANTRWAREQMP